MAKTTWEMYDRVPLTWVLDDGTTMTEPLLEVTSGYRRVRSAVNPSADAARTRADDLAFTEVVRAAARQGRAVMCRDLPEEVLLMLCRNHNGRNGNIAPGTLQDKPPVLHVLTPTQEERGSGQYDWGKTTFWSLYKHPTLPFRMVSWVQIQHHGYGPGMLARGVAHAPLLADTRTWATLPELFTAPDPTMLSFQLGVEGPNARLHGQKSVIPSEFYEHYKPEVAVRVGEGRRETLRQFIIEATRELDEGLTVPDVWGLWAAEDLATFQAREVEMVLVKTNLDRDTIESMKPFATGEAAIGKAMGLYKELLSALSEAGIVLAPLKENDFYQLLGGRTQVLQTHIDGEANMALRGSGPRDSVDFGNPYREHMTLLDLASGELTTTCPIKDAAPEVQEARHAWEEALTVASLSGHEVEFTEFATKYIDDRSRTAILERALARRKQ